MRSSLLTCSAVSGIVLLMAVLSITTFFSVIKDGACDTDPSEENLFGGVNHDN